MRRGNCRRFVISCKGNNCCSFGKLISLFPLVSEFLSSCLCWSLIISLLNYSLFCREEQGWRSGKSARLPPLWPGIDSRTRCHMYAEFVVGSCPCSKGFLRGLRFSSLYKTQHSKFQFDQDRGPAWKSAKADVASSLNIVIYLFYFYSSR